MEEGWSRGALLFIPENGKTFLWVPIQDRNLDYQGKMMENVFRLIFHNPLELVSLLTNPSVSCDNCDIVGDVKFGDRNGNRSPGNLETAHALCLSTPA